MTTSAVNRLPLTGNIASPEVAALLDAVSVLREPNTAGRTVVPDHATTAAATSAAARAAGSASDLRG